jgi:DUF971 family protein
MKNKELIMAKLNKCCTQNNYSLINIEICEYLGNICLKLTFDCLHNNLQVYVWYYNTSDIFNLPKIIKNLLGANNKALISLGLNLLINI